MEYSFANRQIARVCTKHSSAVQKHGAILAGKIYERLDSIDAMESLADFYQIDPHFKPLQGKAWAGCYETRLNRQFRMIVRPSGMFDSDEYGTVDLTTVKSVEIVEACKDVH